MRPAGAIAALGYSSDDINALALLFLPVLIIAASLGVSQTWQRTMRGLPELISRPPVEVAMPAPRPGPVAPPAPVTPSPASLDATRPPPQIALPGTLSLPRVAPQIEVAALDVRPASPDIVIPGATPQLPRNAPTIDLPPRPVEVAVPGPSPLLPRIAPMIETPPAATPAPTIDVAAWSPPRSDMDGRLREPPAIDIVPPPPALPTGEGEVCRPTDKQSASFAMVGRANRAPRLPQADASDPAAFGMKLAAAAREQTRDLVIYSARYQAMAFPLGDMASFYGACTDVIIRAYRAMGIDLQELVQRSHVGRGDPNIDHRRTETLRAYFSRQGASLPVTAFPEDYKPGDIVTYHRPFSRVSASHIAVVSDVLARPAGR